MQNPLGNLLILYMCISWKDLECFLILLLDYLLRHCINSDFKKICITLLPYRTIKTDFLNNYEAKQYEQEHKKASLIQINRRIEMGNMIYQIFKMNYNLWCSDTEGNWSYPGCCVVLARNSFPACTSIHLFFPSVWSALLSSQMPLYPQGWKVSFVKSPLMHSAGLPSVLNCSIALWFHYLSDGWKASRILKSLYHL